MKNLFNKYLNKAGMLILTLVVLGLINACIENDLPGTGSIPDENPPVASFSYASQANFVDIKFTNSSKEALTYEWDFGVEGAEVPDSVLIMEDPSFTYPGVGEYNVTLSATDGLGVTSDTTITIVVEEGPYQPFILEPGFEDFQLEGDSGDGRDSWRTKTWTEDGNSWSDDYSVFGISTSPVTFGDQAAKLEPQPGNPRAGYQEIIVEADQNYDLFFWYTMKAGSDNPWAIVSIIGVTDNAPIDTRVKAEASIIASVTVNDDSDPETYVQEKLSFNSGTNTTIAIYFWNEGNVETRLDDFSIDIGSSGGVPPSVSFNAEQGESVTSSDSLWLEYTFTNASINAATYSWDFGDGSNISTEESPVHTYDEAGTYTITLTATTEGGIEGSFSSNITINAPVTSNFGYEVDEDDYRTYMFADSSVNAETLLWEFGDGFQFTGMNPTHTYAEDGIYTVVLTATSITGLTATSTQLITLTAGAIIPVITNGDFTDSQSGWKIGTFTGGNNNPFNASSDGSWFSYDGVLGTEKTPGAKWTQSTSAGEYKSADTRYAIQSITLTPNTEYILEYEYAIKDDTDDEGTPIVDPVGGRRVIGEILPGHYTDGADSQAASEASEALVTHVGTIAEGKFSATVGEKVQAEFISNDSGEVSIYFWAVTPVDAYVDNVRVYPKN